MSDSERATEIVQHALRSISERGVALRASAHSLAQLAATAGLTTQPAATRSPSLPETAPAPARKLTDLVADLVAEPPPLISTPPLMVATPHLTTVAGATELAPSTGTKRERIAAMRGPVLACMQCPHLVKSRTQVVFGVGDPEAELMFVGEAPGADEDLVGEPFVGKAGQLLTKIIETMGFRRSEVYIANVLKCRPDMPPGASGNRKPAPSEMATCKPYLLEQINIIQPRVLVALGGTAIEGLLEIEKAGITRMRGNWQEFHGLPLMPTFHPSYLLRNQALAEKRRVWEDMLAVLERLGRPISEKQRSYFLARN